ncbi:hypothetical protein LTR84_008133 [Exophiala bonariae]|uniref:tRNA dimethylallyltransferase n=1 Tax=Exophiala bonariae TaxID=1690606 RepID=A0AAV9NPR7_9EURO|nr:hypothetical protein LTR84_008133 [Exophiala bonariae]
MQMYKGLPVITNKIPEIERNGIPHHLIDCIGLEEKPWTVSEFVKETSHIITQIRSRGKLPIVVGGTHYYTHALLFEDATLASEVEHDGDSDVSDIEKERKWPILSRSTEEIYARLQEVDPEMASRWHPNDRRKIQRSLQIWLTSGRKPSDIYAEQQQHRQAAKESEDQNKLQSVGHRLEGLRFPTLLLWLEAEDSILKDRLNKRVDAMVQDGLIEEAQGLVELKKNLAHQGISVDTSKGIWVSIGYKEMEPYFDQRATEVDSEPVSQKLQEALELVRAGTRRYAKRQNRYIRIRLADALKEANQLDKLFLLDGTSLDDWQSSVFIPSADIVNLFLKGEQLPAPASLSTLAIQMSQAILEGRIGTQRVSRKCETCQKILMTDKEWAGHLSSRGHKKNMAGERRRKLPGSSSPRVSTNITKTMQDDPASLLT